jgi:predicted glycoside hydrolase/deacetylase ChbG (UPF0249 family)
MIPLIVNADDFGYSDGICKAIRELFQHHAISATSFMPAAVGAFERAERWSISEYTDSVGVHLQLTSGRPCLRPTQVPSLIDPRTGAFKSKGQLGTVDPEDAYKEWERQIQLTAELFGCGPSHLDSHHGAHRLPILFEPFLALAKKYKASVRGGPSGYEQQLTDAGVFSPNAIIREWTGRELGERGIHDILTPISKLSLPPRSAILVSHPGYCDAALLKISSLNTAREDDRAALEALSKSDWLEKHGFYLDTYRNLATNR